MSLDEEIRASASEAVERFQDRVSGPLDFSIASLARVEELLDEASDFAADMPEEAAKGIIETLGCYVLEVGRREFGGEYKWGRGQPVLVVGEPEFHVALMTWDKVRGRLNGDAGDNIVFHFQGFAERARAAKPGDSVLFV